VVFMQSFLSGDTEREAYSRTPSPGLMMQGTSQDYSPTPTGASMSSHSSPGSYSDHISGIPDPFRVSSAPGFPATTTSGIMETSQWGIFPTPSENTGGNVPRVVSTLSETTNQSSATVASKPSSPRPAGKPAATSRRKKTKTGGEAAPTTNRRQKRLERNRESARLSRRRRKQYLEVLEEKVTQLGQEMDQGRREHVTEALQTIVNKRKAILEGPALPSIEQLAILEVGLSRTSNELMVSTTFQSQQLKSFSLPPSTKFMMWLTLQTDTYYRGGRAASERLSAARIGERVSYFCSLFSCLAVDMVLTYSTLVPLLFNRSFITERIEGHRSSPCGLSFAMRLACLTIKRRRFARSSERCFFPRILG
jgi:hypothetical protein